MEINNITVADGAIRMSFECLNSFMCEIKYFDDGNVSRPKIYGGRNTKINYNILHMMLFDKKVIFHTTKTSCAIYNQASGQ